MAGARFDALSTGASALLAMRNVGAAMLGWNDPRRRVLRQRRTARRTTLGLGSITGAFTAGTAGLVALDAPSLLIAGGCGAAVLVGAPTVGAAMRLRQLHKVPLPLERALRASGPPRSSAAHPALRRLSAAERSLGELVRLLDADVTVPGWWVQDAGAAATAAAVALRKEATVLVALERARDTSAVVAAELSPVVHQAASRLAHGVQEYERVVAAAARAVATTSSGAVAAHGRSLRDTADRIDALTAALAELTRIHGFPANGGHGPC